MLMLIVKVLVSILITVLIFPFFLNILSFLARFFQKTQVAKNSAEMNFGIIITAYQEYKLSLPLVDRLISQKNYSKFHIYLVADRCKLLQEDKDKYKEFPITFLQPEKALNSKVKSFLFAVNIEKNACDAYIVFDPDNIVDINFLHDVNCYFQRIYRSSNS